MSRFQSSQVGSSKPCIGITIGDPSGIGPEISLKAAASDDVLSICYPILIGDPDYLGEWIGRLGISRDFTVIPPGSRANSPNPMISPVANLPDPVEMGCERATSGRAAGQYIEAAVEMCLNGMIDAMTTAPINKHALHLGGYNYPGHTEMLAALTHTDDYAMSFVAPQLRVALLTTHLALADVPAQVTAVALCRLIRLVHREMVRYGFEHPRIALAALNPHGGESGLFGHEEADEMTPAINACRNEDGMDVTGPHSGDTVFVRAARGEFDIVISCYHDQGLIPIKCYSFGEAVNVTMGLPFIRTSVDHGTAFDIAGQGKANHGSMVTAIKLAAELVMSSRSG